MVSAMPVVQMARHGQSSTTCRLPRRLHRSPERRVNARIYSDLVPASKKRLVQLVAISTKIV